MYLKVVLDYWCFYHNVGWVSLSSQVFSSILFSDKNNSNQYNMGDEIFS